MKPILDVCCGGKMFYADKNDSRVMFCDIRKLPRQKLSNGGYFEVAPDVQADFTNLPFEDEKFKLIIFDPPHVNCGERSFLYVKYGTLRKNWKEALTKGFSECFRVLSAGGTLIFKWSDCRFALKEILELTPERTVITHRAKSTSGKANTYFCVFYKEEK
jgi:ubiquinone/menaquinone biosynthesis C-methylase UbiE